MVQLLLPSPFKALDTAECRKKEEVKRMFERDQVPILRINLVKVAKLEEIFVVEESPFLYNTCIVGVDLGHYHVH